MSERERNKLLQSLTDDEAESILYDWQWWARPNQFLPPGDWITWLILAGRGFGKTRTGAETVKLWVRQGFKRIGLIAPTASDARDTMVEGESGLLSIYPPRYRPMYEPSKRRVIFPEGAVGYLYSADEPDRLRGKQHEKVWADEAAVWRYQEAWDEMLLGLRLGLHPQVVVTTTPKPIKLIRDMIKDPTCKITSGNTYENRFNLAPAFIQRIISRYEGTRLGRQELYAEILAESEGASFKRSWLDDHRILPDRDSLKPRLPEFARKVVAIDPATTAEVESDDTGINVSAIDDRMPRHGYVLEDATMKGTPLEWASKAVQLYHLHKADLIIGEANNGGDLIEAVIRTVPEKDGLPGGDNVAYKKVHASRGKHARIEPVASLYERGLVHHVGYFAHLEDEQCNWEPGMKSPNRLDALTWAMTELMLGTTDLVFA